MSVKIIEPKLELLTPGIIIGRKLNLYINGKLVTKYPNNHNYFFAINLEKKSQDGIFRLKSTYINSGALEYGKSLETIHSSRIFKYIALKRENKRKYGVLQNGIEKLVETENLKPLPNLYFENNKLIMHSLNEASTMEDKAVFFYELTKKSKKKLFLVNE